MENLVKELTKILRAKEAIGLGLSVFPTLPNQKVPADSWGGFRKRRMTEQEAAVAFRNGCEIALVCGPISGNLAFLDFDDPNSFKPFLDTLEGVNPNLRAKLSVWQDTPSGGYHLAFRCTSPVGGSAKLAMGRKHIGEDGKPKQETILEVKADGGYVLLAPSMAVPKQKGDPKPYVLHGALADIPTITAEERDLLYAIARSFDESSHQEERRTASTGSSQGTRPGDKFNAETDWNTLLTGYGWTPGRIVGDREQWCRPGKTGAVSGTLHLERGLYVFSSSTPLPMQRPLDQFAVFTWYEHSGDFHAAARALAGHTKTGTTTEDLQQADQSSGVLQQSTQPSFDPAKALEAFEVTREYVEKLGKERFLFPNLIIAQHIITVIAESGGGKTTFFFNIVAPNLARQGLRVWYIDADSPPSEHPRMKDAADAFGFRFLNPDANQGTSVEGLLDTLKQASESDADLTDWVFFIDTLKKMADLLQKNSVKAFFSMCRKLAARGATMVLLGHANKYRDTAGQLVFEGVGDVKSDSDELIFFERQPNQSGGINVTTVVDPTKGAKVRGIFQPFSFHISREREVTFYEQPLVVPDRTASATARVTDDEVLGAAEVYLREIGEPVLQRQLVERVCDVTGAASKRVRKLLAQHSETKVDGQQQGLRFVYTIGDRNAHFYELPN